MKICICCKELKDIKDYYKHPQMGDGHLNKCKQCCKKQTSERHFKKKESLEYVMRERERGRDKYKRLYSGKKVEPTKKKRCVLRYKQKYPEKFIALALLGKSVLAPKGFERHHWSYNTEHAKDVIILSSANHAFIHRYLVYDQNFKMYRTLNGFLLNSRELHEDYINKLLSVLRDVA